MKKLMLISAAFLGGSAAFATLDENGLEPLVWTTFDAQTMANQGTCAHVVWGDAGIHYEATEDGYAGYVDTTNQYPYYKNTGSNIQWAGAESCTLTGVFKAGGDASGAYVCLFGMGWCDTHVIVGATANAVKLAWRGNTEFISTADGSTLEAGYLTAESTDDLTAEYHTYTLVYDHTAHELRVYLDGTCIITKTDVKMNLGAWNTTQGGIFGMPGGPTQGGNPIRNAQTRCDDYRIYGVALTETQIAGLCGQGLAAGAWSTAVDYNANAEAMFMTGAGKTAWMTSAGGECTGTKHRMQNANGTDEVATIFHDGNAEADKWHPYWSGFAKRTAFTIAAYVNFDDTMISDEKTYGVVWCMGNNRGTEVALLVDAAGNLYAGNMTAGEPAEGTMAKIDASDVTEGYHLVTVEFSNELGTKITLDDGTAVVVCAAANQTATNNGLQIGSILSGLTGSCGRALLVGISDIFYYDAPLAKGAAAELYAELEAKYPVSQPETNDAEVDGIKYASLADAVLNIMNNKTLKVLRDITLEETIVLDALTKGTIDLNGHTIAATGDQVAFDIASGANLAIQGSGAIISETGDYSVRSAAAYLYLDPVNGSPDIDGIIALPAADTAQNPSAIFLSEGYSPTRRVKVFADWTGKLDNSKTTVINFVGNKTTSGEDVIDFSYDPIKEIEGEIYYADFHSAFATADLLVYRMEYVHKTGPVTIEMTNATIWYLQGVITDPDTGLKYAAFERCVKTGSIIQGGVSVPQYSWLAPKNNEITFEVRIPEGYCNPVVTVNGEAVEPVEGHYTITPVKTGTAIVVSSELIPELPTYGGVSESTTLEQIVPGITEAQLQTLRNAGVTAKDIAAWAMTMGGLSSTQTIGGVGAINLAAFALACTPAELATKQLRIAIKADANGVLMPCLAEGVKVNVQPVYEGKAALTDEAWVEVTAENKTTLKFFRAVIRL